MNDKKILFACDLDNTLIHSHRRRSEVDICVELLNGREQSFITPYAQSLVEKIQSAENIMLVPVTTRSVEQYRRIQWQEGCAPELALVCNGSVLLRNGSIDDEWRKESVELTRPYEEELKRLCGMYSGYSCFKTVRIVDGMFLFAYCREEENTAEIAADCAGDTVLRTQYSGHKLYFFPPAADKGRAVRRLFQELEFSEIIAAGDSVIDLPMLEEADRALVPDNDIAEQLKKSCVSVCKEGVPFSEFILRSVLDRSV